VGLVAADVPVGDTLDGLAGLPFAAISVDPASARDGEALRRGIEALAGRAADLGLGVQAGGVRTAAELAVLRSVPAVVAARGPAVAAPVDASALDALARRGGPLATRPRP